MIHDVISMSAGLTEGENNRILVVSFDPRIDTESVLAFTRQSLSELVFKAENMGTCEPKTGKDQTLRRGYAAAGTAPDDETAFKSAQREPFKSERDKACALANIWLDRTMADPDSDDSVLSRSYLRAIEKIHRLSKILDGLLEVSDERHSSIFGYTIEDLNREAADRWPMPPEAKE